MSALQALAVGDIMLAPAVGTLTAWLSGPGRGARACWCGSLATPRVAEGPLGSCGPGLPASVSPSPRRPGRRRHPGVHEGPRPLARNPRPRSIRSRFARGDGAVIAARVWSAVRLTASSEDLRGCRPPGKPLRAGRIDCLLVADAHIGYESAPRLSTVTGVTSGGRNSSPARRQCVRWSRLPTQPADFRRARLRGRTEFGCRSRLPAGTRHARRPRLPANRFSNWARN
jgi:hypothetical protein